ncbi:rRNA methyltransferase, mitochondrial [Diplodia seriata]|uniref:rRNA methyltransferase, mitochondrial n=1 Tax=Diplodia seriata TaxID=420778 RepID=A0A1S8BBX9_9PEZI|nr:rRNA methyltransferase, mitochondrial [Diplodia seriata]
MVDDSFLPAMDKMSDYRPHNGVILEASPLPVLPVVNLRPVQRTRPYFDIDLDKQSREEARINGTNSRLKYNSHGWRYPFILYLDGIVDEGNIGAIMRTAYYFGVDAVALSKRGTAPIDSVALKASSGAAEGLPILTVANPHTFLHRSTHNNGWRLYAADVPLPPRDNFNVTADHTYAALDPLNTSPLVSFTRPHTLATLRDHSPLLQHPAILMLGGEAAGFRHSIRAKANYLVGVRGTAGLAMGVDSLNVSVAAALIMLEMLRRPKVADVVKRRVDQNYDYGREKREKARRDANQLARKTDDSVSNDELLF